MQRVQMMRNSAEYITKVSEWAKDSGEVISLALVGSYARNQARPDSDIDFMILCGDKNALIKKVSWLVIFGEPARIEKEEWGVVDAYRVHYHDGPEIEFGIANVSWADIPIDAGTRQVVANGMQILVDKTGLLGKLQESIRQP